MATAWPARVLALAARRAKERRELPNEVVTCVPVAALSKYLSGVSFAATWEHCWTNQQGHPWRGQTEQPSVSAELYHVTNRLQSSVCHSSGANPLRLLRWIVMRLLRTCVLSPTCRVFVDSSLTSRDRGKRVRTVQRPSKANKPNNYRTCTVCLICFLSSVARSGIVAFVRCANSASNLAGCCE